MTVGTVRALVNGDRITPAKSLLQRGAAGTLEEGCTYLGSGDASNDALPITCIGAALAGEVCKALGKRLPDEYEWEFAATNGTDETTYPWGNPEGVAEDLFLNDYVRVTCAHAIVGRGRKSQTSEKQGCGTSSWGPVAGGNPLDLTRAGVKNMGGNVAEWTGDLDFHLYDEPCWSTNSCDGPSPELSFGTWRPYRGGSWARSPDSAVGVGRYAMFNGAPSPYVGFRCATDDDALP
jgi:formylglycine-generating enzyme required for sulfatase activity